MKQPMSASGECLEPWSTPLIKSTLEYTVGDRPASTDPVHDRMWRSRAESLMFWANRRPDVAARTLACTLFSDTPIVPPPPIPSSTTGTATTASPSPRLPSKLHDMCVHALRVQAEYNEEAASLAQASSGTAIKEIPQEEVTFMATLVAPCVRQGGASGLPDCRGALETLFTRGKGERGLATWVQKPFMELLHSTTPAPSNSTTGASECGEAQEAPIPTAQLPLDAWLPVHLSLLHGDGSLLLPPMAQSGQFSLDSREDRIREGSCGGGLGDVCVGLPTPPFQARSREEVARAALDEDARLRSTTLVRVEERATIARPKWAGEVESKYDTIGSKPAAPAPEKDENTESVEGQAVHPPDDASTRPAAALPQRIEATVIEGGEILFRNGRVVVVEQRQKQPPTAVDGKKKRQRDSGGTAGDAPTDAPIAKHARSEAMSTVVEGGDGNAPGPSSARTAQRGQKTKRGAAKKNAPLNSTSPSAAVVGLQGVPLKPREELVEMVNQMDISDTLRAAFLIGLEPPAARQETEEGAVDAIPKASHQPPPPTRNTADAAPVEDDHACGARKDAEAPLVKAGGSVDTTGTVKSTEALLGDWESQSLEAPEKR